jgi:GMP synthase (glutamine-hydrolysing)
MPAVLILQHLLSDGPGFLATWLQQRGQPFDCPCTEAGQGFPQRMDGYAALAVLGGEWSANDERPSLRQAEALIREAVDRGLPVLGHCLGGQLMSRALGSSVGLSPEPERGWHAVSVADSPEARAWFGSARTARLFQWHSESFGLPAGAQLLAGNEACRHQAWSLGPHLAMQFHVEVDETKLAHWFDDAEQWPWAAGRGRPTVHDAARMRAETGAALAGSQALAARIYERWLGMAAGLG